MIPQISILNEVLRLIAVVVLTNCTLLLFHDYALLAEDFVGPDWTTRLANGRELRTRFRRTDVGLLPFAIASSNESAALTQVSRNIDLVPSFPLRRIILINGDSFVAPVIKMDQQTLYLHTSSFTQQISRNAVAAIESLALRKDVFWFEGSEEAWKTQPASQIGEDAMFGGTRKLHLGTVAELLLPRPVSHCELVLWLLPTEQRHLTIELVSDDSTFVFQPQLRPIPGFNNWTCIRIHIGERDLIAIGREIIANPTFNITSLRRLRLVSSSNADESQTHSSMILGSCFVSEVTQPTGRQRSASLRNHLHDSVCLRNGDTVYGTLARVDAAGVKLDIGERTQVIRWQEIQSLNRKLIDSPAVLPTTGWQVQLELQSTSGEDSLYQSDLITGAIINATSEGLTVQHGIIGEIQLNWNAIRRITPYFTGASQLISYLPRHLGTQTRNDFQHPVPEGTRLSIPFEIATLVDSPNSLDLVVSDLEPSGPGTVRTSPALADLNTGFLESRLFLNDQPIGRLNDYISRWSLPGLPQRLRIRFDRGALKLGRNQFEIRQRPSQADDTRFDDFELLSASLISIAEEP